MCVRAETFFNLFSSPPVHTAHFSCGYLVIFCCSDEAVFFPIQKGVLASRSKVKYFKHNDMDHLEQLLEESKKIDDKVTSSHGPPNLK